MSNNTNNIPATATYKRLFSYTRVYLLAFIVAIFANIIYATVDGVFIDGMTPMVDEGLFKKDASFLIIAPLFVISLVAIRSIASFVSGYLMGWVGQNVVADLRKDVFKKYMDLPAEYIDSHVTGDMVSKLTFNAEKVAVTATHAITVIIRESGFLIYVLISMLSKSVFLTSLYLISIPLIAVVVKAATVRFKDASQSMQDAMGEITNISSEGLKGYRTVKIHNGQNQVSQLFNFAVNKFRNKFMKLVATKNASSPLVQFFAAAGLSVVLYFSLQEVQNGNLTAGTFTSMIFFMMAILRPLKQLTAINSQIQSGLVAANSLFAVLDLKTETDEGHFELEHFKGKIEFIDVSLQYKNRNQKALKNFNFVANPGDLIAIVGASGSGKSTLLNILMRLYQPDTGTILFDGKDIQEISLRSLRNQIALVSQSVTLFNDTIENNLTFGLEKTCSEEEIITALVMANAYEFIQQLPDGIHTLVDDHLSTLSGGQLQRLAIARAILRNSPLLLLDEATSALDSESEEKIQQSLNKVMQNKTTFVVAHRLSTIRNADIILVMDSGELIEKGNHQQLLQQQGTYSRLYELQFGKTSE